MIRRRPIPRPLERLLLIPLRMGLVLARETRTMGSMAVLVSEEDRVLLVRTWYRSQWGLPGGYLRRRETPQRAVQRELREEIGLDIDLAEWDERPRFVLQPERRHIDFIFSAPATKAHVAAAHPTSREIVEVGWFELDALPPLQPEAVTALDVAGVRAAP